LSALTRSRVFFVSLVCVLQACASASSIRSAPLTAGVTRTFGADQQLMRRLVRIAVIEVGLQLENVEEIDERTWTIIATKPASTFSYGEIVRVAVIAETAGRTRVLVHTKRRLATNVTAKGDYSAAVFASIASKLEEAALAARTDSAHAPKPATPTSPPRGPSASGSGFFVTSDGFILTNAHVVDACEEVRIAGQRYPATLVRKDSENDLALLRSTEGRAEAAVLRAGPMVRAGDAAIAVGFPLAGLLASEPNVTVGGVSALAGLRDDFRFLQITAPVQPGNSGGPLLDVSGNVIGIVTAKLDALRVARATGDVPQNINFALNVSVARVFLDALGIAYRSAPSSGSLEVAEVAQRAKGYTVLVECWR